VSYKTFDLAADVASLVSSINEVVAVSSSIFKTDANVKFYKNVASGSSAIDLGGYWQTVYDASPTSSLSTALFDITYGYSTGSTYNVAATTTASQDEKVKVYRHFASMLLGNADSVFSVNSADQEECIFIMIKRSMQKDELKKGSISIILNQQSSQVTGSDPSAATSFKQTVGGDYAPLKWAGTGSEVGQVWYQQGVIVLPTSLAYPASVTWSGSKTLIELQYSGTINQICDGFRKHSDRVDFHNQTNLYSTVYFCRAFNNEFNYSSNPTFVDSDKRIRVTSGSNVLQTRAYITTIGLYDANDNMLACAKTNKPITKSPDTEAVFRVRLDY
jgi:hypothetical protein